FGQLSADAAEVPELEGMLAGSSGQAAAVGAKGEPDDGLRVGGGQSGQFLAGGRVDQAHRTGGGNESQGLAIAAEGHGAGSGPGPRQGRAAWPPRGDLPGAI